MVLLGVDEALSQDGFLKEGTADACAFDASASGTVSSLSVLMKSGTPQKVIVALYANLLTTHDHPNTRLTRGETAMAPDLGWITVKVDPPVKVDKGTRYWIAMLAPGSGAQLNFASSYVSWPLACDTGLDAMATDLPAKWTSSPNYLFSTRRSYYASGH
jgi:hypothetical protein